MPSKQHAIYSSHRRSGVTALAAFNHAVHGRCDKPGTSLVFQMYWGYVGRHWSLVGHSIREVTRKPVTGEKQ